MISFALTKKVLKILFMSTLAFLFIGLVSSVLDAITKPSANIEIVNQDPFDISPVWIGAPITSNPVLYGIEMEVNFSVDSNQQLNIGFPDADTVVIKPSKDITKITFSGYENYVIYTSWDSDNKLWFIFNRIIQIP